MFKLDFDIPINPTQIGLHDQIVSIGSCFSDNIGDKLSQYKFKTLANPFGTLFNPYSTFKALAGKLDKKNIVENQGIFYHWDAHGEISALNARDLEQSIKQKANDLNEWLVSAKWLIITFGSAFVYTHNKSKQIVANCHKVPQNEFSKSLLNPAEIASSYLDCINQIRKINPDLKVILTVSPVRHTKDGLNENNLSKGILHQAVAEIIKKDSLAWYFPSYEIMIDELRDYRFYKVDMIHPSDQAISYIWNKFRHSFIDKTSNSFINEWDKIISAMAHRPFHPESDKHQVFLNSLIEKITPYQSKIDVKKELVMLTNQLIKK
ncbi:MAG: hypothetical protein ACJA08_000663 [Cyclobacteriaceae bacterium]|jgi:hypothetical protein